MVDKRNLKILLTMFIISIATPIILIRTSVVNVDADIFMTDDFHYNMITFSTIIAGFLFTSLGILISSIGNNRIERLWDNKYLDNIPRSSTIGIMYNIITLISAFVLLIFDVSLKVEIILIKIEIATSVASVIFFIYCIIQLLGVINKLKKQN